MEMWNQWKNKQNIRATFYMVLPVLVIACLTFLMILFRKQEGQPAREQVVVALPYSEWVQDYEMNYYTGWLEEKTGYDITFVYLDEGYEKESLRTLLTSENSSVDAVFFPAEQEILSQEEYQRYIREGSLSSPQDYLAADSSLQRVFQEHPEVDFDKLLGEDGRFYCFPSVELARTARNMQILWINIDWLTKLNLTMPHTTEEFREVLAAFRESDANGNGIADELPLVSCEADYPFRSYLYLLNAFTYYDAAHLSWYGKDGGLAAGVRQDGFREGVAYCASLYRQGLLVGDCFFYTGKQLKEMVNDPADTVGAFASHSIADVVYTSNPGILAHFVQMAPLSSGILERGYAVRADIFPGIGGVIPSNAVHKEAAAQIMDVMLSQEASLIAVYGEEGVDWRFSRDGELSTYGTRAKITTIRYLKGKRQDKNYAGAGPLFAAAEYMDGVTWNGDHSMTEYIDARAVKAYEPYYYPSLQEEQKLVDEAIKALGPEQRDAVSAYLETELLNFITGERDVMDEADWERFLAEYGKLAGR